MAAVAGIDRFTSASPSESGRDERAMKSFLYLVAALSLPLGIAGTLLYLLFKPIVRSGDGSNDGTGGWFGGDGDGGGDGGGGGD